MSTTKDAQTTEFICTQCDGPLVPGPASYSCAACDARYPIVDQIPCFAADAPDAHKGFDASLFETLWEAEQTNFWFIGRRELVLDTLRRYPPSSGGARMLEVGCGTGGLLHFLAENSPLELEGGDIFIESLKLARLRLSNSLYQLDVLRLPFQENFDVVGLFDVLEHIPDDEAALRRVNRALRPGGTLMATVPAYPSLWSYFDDLAAHQRRYRKRELLAKLDQAGFSVQHFSHFMMFLLPLAAVYRKLIASRRSAEGRAGSISDGELRTYPLLNPMLLAVQRIERLLMRRTSLPFGMSMLVVATKCE